MNLERNNILFGDAPASHLSTDYKYIDTKHNKMTILYYQKKKKTAELLYCHYRLSMPFEIIRWNQFP